MIACLFGLWYSSQGNYLFSEIIIVFRENNSKSDTKEKRNVIKTRTH